MPVYKDKKRKSWYVSKRYKDWKGDNQREVKRGFQSKKEASDYEKEFVSKLNGNQNRECEELCVSNIRHG